MAKKLSTAPVTTGTTETSSEEPSMAARAPVSENTSNWMWKILSALALIIVIAGIVSVVRGYAVKGQLAVANEQKQSLVREQVAGKIPLAGTPKQLILPAGGKSENIYVPPGMHAVVDGEHFLVHNVYLVDGHECAFGESCVDGPLASMYVTNEDTQNQNTVVYHFE